MAFYCYIWKQDVIMVLKNTFCSESLCPMLFLYSNHKITLILYSVCHVILCYNMILYNLDIYNCFHQTPHDETDLHVYSIYLYSLGKYHELLCPSVTIHFWSC